MTRRVQSRHLDTGANGETGVVRRRLDHFIAVLAADDGHRVSGRDFDVATRVVVMVVSVDDALQVDLAGVYLLLQYWQNFWWVRRVDDDGVFGLRVRDEVGIVVARSLPCSLASASGVVQTRSLASRMSQRTHWNRLDMH